MSSVPHCLCVPIFLFLLLAQSLSQTPAVSAGPNSDPAYRQLRNIKLGDDQFTVTNLDLKRDAATFHLRSGTVCFVLAVDRKVTGAVFEGDGTMELTPPLPGEKKMLKLLTKEDQFSENFSQLVLRFTDSTRDEIAKAGTPTSKKCDEGPLRDSQNVLRHGHVLRYNLDARILEDVLGSETEGLFVAFIHGKRYSSKLLYMIDPHGAPTVQPEEVELLTLDENKFGIWAAFHFSSEYAHGSDTGAEKNAVLHVKHQLLDTTIERSGNLIGKATTTFVSALDGLRVAPFDLFPTLRVQSVTGADGQAISFIQEDKNEDADFHIILPKPLARGEELTLTTTYAGKEVVSSQGGGNYYPVARSSWFPNGSLTFGEYVPYDMTFRIPKGMTMVASGSLISESDVEGQNVSIWKSDGPIAVAGFNFGRFKREEGKVEKSGYIIDSYANVEVPDWVKGVQRFASDEALPTLMAPEGENVALGNMSTVGLNKKALAEAQLAVQLYTNYFGPPPYSRLSLTQQTAQNYGQAWPGLIYLPITYFFDTTTRHSLFNMARDRCPSCFPRGEDPYGYYKVVAPHEVAHQWWGHMVGFNSYRDQWMGEGFADASASIYLQMVYTKQPQRYLSFWNDERDLLTQRNKEGFRAIDIGPLTMGYRLNNSRSGFDTTRDLIYPKGAYILHMIRMMMWNRQTGDQTFKETMQDFARTYAGKAATTEDFKAMVEKHMTPEMVAVTAGKNMNWFFDEYVYGTALPTYKLDYTLDNGADGKMVFKFNLAQSGVDDSFRMLVPLYFELDDGRTILLGRVRMTGNTTVSQEVPLGALKPKRALVNYFYDILASPN